MKKKVAIILILLSHFAFTQVNSEQEQEELSLTGHNKNVLYATGFLDFIGSGFGLNFERHKWRYKEENLTHWLSLIGLGRAHNYSFFGKCSVSLWKDDLGGDYEYRLNAQIGYIKQIEGKAWGKEIAAGLFIWGEDGFPSFNIGYRYQKPLKRFVFRGGVGFPEMLYSSVGFSF